jgi:flagellar protein FlbT
MMRAHASRKDDAMPLRFDLAPFEKLHFGTAVLIGSHERTRFALDGDMPVLRDRDFLPPEAAATAVERLYCRLQKIYLENALTSMLGVYLTAMTQATESDPERAAELREVDALAMAGDLYKALRALRKLIRPEAFAKDAVEPKQYVRRGGAAR